MEENNGGNLDTFGKMRDEKEGILSGEGTSNDIFSDDSFIGNALEDANKEAIKEEAKRQKALKTKASKGRKEKNKIKKEMGIRRGKQSKFPTRSHDFLGEKQSDRAIHIVLNNQMTEVYKDGADICPRILMGIPAFGKKCTKSAFEHLITVQEKIKLVRGDDPKKAPEWIIINNDTSMIMDRNLLSRLEELKSNTQVVGAYGFEQIRASGKWYQLDNPKEQLTLRGCYIQSNMDNNNWDFIVGNQFKNSDKYRVLIVHGPFIAVRGELFMQIDFTDMVDNYKGGFFHYMAEISMECYKRKLMIGQIKTVSAQFENINKMKEDPDFQHDQSYFASKWQPYLPAHFNGKR